MRYLALITLLFISSGCLAYCDETVASVTNSPSSEEWVAAFQRLTVRDIIVVETSYVRNPHAATGLGTISFKPVTKLQACGSLLIVTYQSPTEKKVSVEVVIPADKVVSITGMDTRTSAKVEMDRLNEAREEKRLQEKAQKEEQSQRSSTVKVKE